MKIGTILGIALTIFLLLLIGCLLINNFSTQNTIIIGDTTFLLPEGYKEDGVNKFGAITLTDGNNQIYILKHENDSNVNKYISEYKKVIKKKNETMTIEKITRNNTIFYKTKNIDNPKVTHIWFVKNGDTYETYKFNENSKFEASVLYLSNHMT